MKLILRVFKRTYSNLGKSHRCLSQEDNTGVPAVTQQKQIGVVSMRTQVQSLVLLSELRIQHCCEL